MNDAGEAVGYAYLLGDATFHATLWTQVGNMTDLGVVGKDTCSFASSVNAETQVVGESAPRCNFDNARAFLWEGGSLLNLNDLILDRLGLHLQSAENINDRGEIAGTGLDATGNGHVVLLIPCDANHPNIEGCDYRSADGTAELNADPAQDSNSLAPTGTESNLSPVEMRAQFRFFKTGRRRLGTLDPPTK